MPRRLPRPVCSSALAAPVRRGARLPVPAEIPGVIRAAAYERPAIEARGTPLQLVPYALEADGLGRDRAPPVLPFEQEPVVGTPWTIRGSHQPDPLDVLPAERLALSFRMLAGNLVSRNHEPIFALRVRLREPGLKNGDQEAANRSEEE